jgi:exodeoxyribonuclease VII small subunit
MNEVKFSYEKSIARIKEISEVLKQNPTQFEENLKLFSEAMTLIKKCKSYIENAEIKVQAIIDGKLEDYDLENQKLIIHSKPEQKPLNIDNNDDLPF